MLPLHYITVAAQPTGKQDNKNLHPIHSFKKQCLNCIISDARANKTYDDTKVDASWGQGIGANGGRFAHQVASEQLREQLSAVTTAQIPDREAVAIWQDTLAEASEQGLSAEAGFELLCERMTKWEKE